MDDVFRDLLATARKRSTIPYSDLMKSYHLPRGGWAQQNSVRKDVGWVVYVVGQVSEIRFGISLDSLVVRKGTGLPAPGYHGGDENKDDARQQQEACWDRITKLSEADFQFVLKNQKLP
jgi:hypothetical protein